MDSLFSSLLVNLRLILKSTFYLSIIFQQYPIIDEILHKQ